MDSTQLFRSLKTPLSIMVLATTVLASGVTSFAGTAMTIALPVIQLELNASLSQIQWALNSYTLMLGIFILIAGAIADIIGRKKILVAGLIIFTISSALLFSAQNIWVFIVYRVLQGLGAALVIPLSLAIINSNYQRSIRGWVIGIWSGLTGLISITAPVLAGAIIETWGWRGIFASMIPFAVVSLLLTWWVVKDKARAQHFNWSKFDFRGSFCLILAMCGLSYAAIQSSEQGLTTLNIVSLVIGLGLLMLFVMLEANHSQPLIPIKLFKQVHILGANLFTFLLYGTLGGVFVYLIMNLQQVQGLSPTQASYSLLPTMILVTGLSFITGKIADAWGNKWPTVAGSLIVALGTVWLINVDNNFNYWLDLIPGTILIGMGFGIFVPALTKEALDVAEKNSGAASGLNNAIARFTPLLAIALFSWIILNSFTNQISESRVFNQAETSAQHQIKNSTQKLFGLDIPASVDQASLLPIMKTGFIKGYQQAMILASVASVMGALIAGLSFKKRQ